MQKPSSGSQNNHAVFPGFPATLERASWQFPSIINGYAHSLTGGEFKILWYILRHTYGWQKNCDRLSISQICNGIKRKKDGSYLDKGTGLSRSWAIKTLNSLEDKGFVRIEKVKGEVNVIYPRVTGIESTPLPVTQTTPVAGIQTTPTNNSIPVNNTNIIPASQKPQKKTYKEEVHKVISYLSERLDGVRFPNYGKQAHYAKTMLDTGYTVESICWAIDKMLSDAWWNQHSFDLKNVADEIPKLMTRTFKEGNSKA